MNSMLVWLSILLLIFIIYYLWNKKSIIKEKFQNQNDDNAPPINVNVTVSPTLLNSAREVLSNITNSEDSSVPAVTIESICSKLNNDLSFYNSELQRHRDEGNWTHTHAMRSYIDSINKQIGISGC
jgi:hypothetical protein